MRMCEIFTHWDSCGRCTSFTRENHQNWRRASRITGQTCLPWAGAAAKISSVNTDWNRLRGLAQTEISATLNGLPEPLREQARKLPVTFDRRPNAGLQADGIEVDTLGLFTGAEFADSHGEVLPSQIILFLGNLWDYAAWDEEVYCGEVRTTFLHELGHFFGLGEDDLAERGLE